MITVMTVALLAGCSGGGGGGGGGSQAGADRSERSAERTSTTAAPARIDLSQPIPGGSLHGTARPPLENTGDDYVAIFTSIDATFRWLSENPDIAVLDELYVSGTQTHQFQVEFFAELLANGWRAADDGYQLVAVEVIDVQAGLVALRVADSMDFERIVDAAGNQVGEGRPRSPKTKSWNVLIQADTSSQWRIADWSQVEEGTVEL